MLPTAELDLIRRFRCAPTGGDALRERRRFEAVLGAMELHPAGLSRSAILCVRQVRVRSSQILSRQNLVVPVGEAPGPGLRELMERLARNAARPASGFVPATAEAVVFHDRAELLTCLARDWLHGVDGAQWWWRSLFPGHGIAEAMEEAWRDAPSHVPPALAELRQTGNEVAFLRALPSSITLRIGQNVARAFALEELWIALPQAMEVTRIERTPETRSDSENSPVKFAGKATVDAEIHRPAPWTPWAGEDPALPIAAQVLRVLSVLLFQAPAVVRSMKFLGDVCEFALLRDQSPEDPHVTRKSIALSREPATVNDRSVAPTREYPVDAPAPGGCPTASRECVAPASRPERTVGMHSQQTEALGETCAASPDHPAGLEEHWSIQRGRPLEEAATGQPTAPTSEQVWATQWGGIFYLINVALALELYGDFTRPRQRSLPLPVWDFLALMGTRLIGPDFVQDNCWRVLARLAGRKEDEPPGAWFEPPRQWRTSDGVIALEDPPGTDPAWPELDRWAARLAEHLLNRLALALAEPSRETLREIVFRHEATLRVSSAQLDAHFSLAAHPLVLRLAGLDRDPGWIPAAGRTIRFHYE